MEKSTIILRIIEGLLDQEKYMLLKKLVSVNPDMKIMILAVSPDDEDMLIEMVTSAAVFVNAEALSKLCGDINYVLPLRKLCIALKYMISGYKTVVDYGAGREERDCTLSIKTPSAHIHIPLSEGDKKTERFISAALTESKELFDKDVNDMLIYYDSTADKTVIESKDDYIRRKYFESAAYDEFSDSDINT